MWRKISKGAAKIWKHPNIDRAVVDGPYGVYFAGNPFDSIESAMAFAENEYNNEFTEHQKYKEKK